MNATDRYVNAIRNPEKRAYAARFLAWRRGRGMDDCPSYKPLSYIAAQAVRIRIYELEGTITRQEA